MNLLTDNLFRVDTPSGTVRMNLPSLLEALGQDRVISFAGIQHHQEDAFHVFLSYLGAVVLARTGAGSAPQSSEFWREGLLQLAHRDDDSAWSLVVEDFEKPAFMQPPLPRKDQAKLQLKANTPDELDLLPTAKNHDLKSARATRPEVDEWIYALISLQTMSGFFGQGNQGISRMNGGFGNRVVVEFRRSRRPGGLWQDALARLGKHRQDVLSGSWGFDPNGLVLVWLPVWDGATSLGLSQLDPFYIEICRRVRLKHNRQTGLRAFSVSAKVPRLAAKDLKGNVGDAWLPIDLTKEAALTVGPSGLTPDLLRRLIFKDDTDMKLTHLQQPLLDAPDGAWLSVSVLVRGKGTTDGFHEKIILVPAKVRKKLFGAGKSERDRLNDLSKTAVEYAATMRKKVLKPAVFAYLEGGPEKIQYDRDAAAAWWQRAHNRFQALWADSYFPWLWEALDRPSSDEAYHDWAQRLCDYALTVLHETLQAMPSHTGRRFRARTRAERLFYGALYGKNNFPFLKEEKRHGESAAP